MRRARRSLKTVWRNCRMGLSYRLKTPWRNGTTHVILDPLEFVARLAVLVPAPRVNLIRFHGLLGPAAKWRAAIVPAPPEKAPVLEACTSEDGEGKKQGRNYSWASLMARVFEVDVLKCSDCIGRLKILAAIHPPVNTRKILECTGLSSRSPPVARLASLAYDSAFEEL